MSCCLSLTLRCLDVRLQTFINVFTKTGIHVQTHTHTPAQGTWRELARAPVRRRAVTAALGLRQLALLSQHGCGGGGDDAHAVSYPRVQRVFPVVIGHGNHSQGKDLRAEKKKRQTVDYTAALVLLPVAAWSHYRPGSIKWTYLLSMNT